MIVHEKETFYAWFDRGLSKRIKYYAQIFYTKLAATEIVVKQKRSFDAFNRLHYYWVLNYRKLKLGNRTSFGFGQFSFSYLLTRTTERLSHWINSTSGSRIVPTVVRISSPLTDQYYPIVLVKKNERLQSVNWKIKL